MNKLITVLLFSLPILSFAVAISEKPNGFVQDFTGILSAQEKILLEEKISGFEKSSTNEIAIVILKKLEGNSIENLAQEIFTKWGIGKEDKNNGVLLLISIEDRKMRIHTGYGVEHLLTDIGTSYIQDDVLVPRFQNGDYYNGINLAVDKMIEALGGKNIVPEGYNSRNIGFSPNFILIAFFILIQWLGAILGRSKEWWHGGVLGGIISMVIWYFFINSIFFGLPFLVFLVGLGLLFDFIVSKAYRKAKDSGGNFPWWIGGGGGGIGGSGFGGFGGGSSGGGGSSRSW